MAHGYVSEQQLITGTCDWELKYQKCPNHTLPCAEIMIGMNRKSEHYLQEMIPAPGGRLLERQTG